MPLPKTERSLIGRQALYLRGLQPGFDNATIVVCFNVPGEAVKTMQCWARCLGRWEEQVPDVP